MRKIETIEEVHKLELDILIAFDKFCKEHDIKYSLGAGTLLGAVRHKGFIPWDDDIDLFMLRSEYEKLLDFAKNGKLIQDRYKIRSPFDEDMPYTFVKIVDTKTKVIEDGKSTDLGLWLDIFPVDFCGNTPEEAEKERKNILLYTNFIFRYLALKGSKKITLKNLIKQMLFFVLKCFGISAPNYFKNKVLMRKHLENAKYAGTIVNSLTKKDVYPSVFFTEGYEYLEFEGCSFPVFKHYEKILSWRYGDFMKLPPEEDRHAHLADVWCEE